MYCVFSSIQNYRKFLNLSTYNMQVLSILLNTVKLQLMYLQLSAYNYLDDV